MGTLLPIDHNPEVNPHLTKAPKKIAILGDGQLGQMGILAGQQMGHDMMTFGQIGENSPSGQVGEYIKVVYDDIKETVAAIIEWGADVVTTEWENISWELAKAIEDAGITMYPNGNVLKVIQHRATEKQAVRDAGYNTTDFDRLDSEDINGMKEARHTLRAFFDKNGHGILKVAHGGYDGKGQEKTTSKVELDEYIERLSAERNISKEYTRIEENGGDKNTFKGREVPLGTEDCIYEKLVDFDYELSVMVARRPNGEIVVYEPAHNTHKDGILDTSIIPAINSVALEGKINIDIVNKAKEISQGIVEHMDFVGILGVEFFVKGDEIVVNELAPRVHNSGHGTVESYNMSQFHTHIKAITNEDFGELVLEQGTELKNKMGNQIKDIPNRDENGAHKIDSTGEITYYDYGKEISNPDGNYKVDRKEGHTISVFSLENTK